MERCYPVSLAIFASWRRQLLRPDLYCIFLEDFVKGKHRCYRAKILSEIIQRSDWEKLKKLEKNKTILMTAVSEKLYYIRVNEEMIKNYEKEIELDNKKMNEALMALE